MSAVTKCMKGHFYDAEKHKECPYCASQTENRQRIARNVEGHPVFAVNDGMDEQKTVAMYQGGGDVVLDRSGGRMGLAGIGAQKEGATVALFSKARGTAFVTGWLVGIEGPVKGRDYRIMHGKNWVGRSYNMDMIISEGDSSIAANNQCALVYDGVGNKFFIMPGVGTTTYVNDEVVAQPMLLKIGDVITMGNCKFEFIPFCREGHVWKAEDIKASR